MTKDVLSFLPRVDISEKERNYKSIYIVPTAMTYKEDPQYRIFTLAGYNPDTDLFEVFGMTDVIDFETVDSCCFKADMSSKENIVKLVTENFLFSVLQIHSSKIRIKVIKDTR